MAVGAGDGAPIIAGLARATRRPDIERAGRRSNTHASRASTPSSPPPISICSTSCASASRECLARRERWSRYGQSVRRRGVLAGGCRPLRPGVPLPGVDVAIGRRDHAEHPDTVGYTTPAEFGALMRASGARARRGDVIISAHCHNDLGLATANTLAGCRTARAGRGDRQWHRRARGNTSMEEVVMALHTRPTVLRPRDRHRYHADCAHQPLVSATPACPCSPTRPSSARTPFAHEAGIHQDGMLKNPHLRDHEAGDDRHQREPPRARQAQRPPCVSVRLPRSGYDLKATS